MMLAQMRFLVVGCALAGCIGLEAAASDSPDLHKPVGAVNEVARATSDGQGDFSASSRSVLSPTPADHFTFQSRVRASTDGDPPKLPTCPGNSLLAQNPDPPNAFTAYTSEQSTNLRRYEKFSAVAGAITGVRWFGLDMVLSGGQWVDCTETDPTFLISFHESSAGIPGPAVCTYTLLAQRMPTGVSYGGFEMNEYRLTLPASCVITNGWLSIQGLGDPNCWFLWMSSPDGDQQSYCQGCGTTVVNDDLSYCLIGSPGGVFGACCNESTGQCTDNVEINQCALPGFRFAPNTLCANLNPPCQVVTGACCFPNNTCAIITSSDCNFGGGTWLGGGTSCTQCPVLGACCMGFNSCSLQTQQDCISEGGAWLGPNTSCANCPPPPTCPEGSLFAQAPVNPNDGFLAGTSEEASVFRRWENFSGVAGPIDSLTWWGLDLKPLGNGQWAECIEVDPTFRISFHKDANGVPGDVVCTYELLATRTPLNILYNGAELNRYEVALPSPCILVHGWVSIVGKGDPQCWFLWMSSGLGSSWCTGCIPSQQGVDLCVCLSGQYGGAVGACCTDSTAQCANNVNIANCTGNDQRFAANITCDQLEPPCGTIVGACCYPNDTCTILQQDDCQSSGGNWIGPNSICSSCPCITPCPAGGVNEGEPICFNNYDDVFNGGCIVPSPNFSPLGINQTVCGRSGVFLIDGVVHGDFDWYEVNLNHATTLTWSVRAEFRTRIWIRNGNAGCPGTTLQFAAATECFDYSVSVFVQPGRYWCIIGPLAFDDNAGCGARYLARATISPPCVGDIAGAPGGGGDDVVNVSDLLAVINQWGPCGPSCPADIAPPGGDGVVNVSDLLAVINHWGPCQ